MRASYGRRRETPYAGGMAEFDRLVEIPTFRDFVVLYIAEGYERNRNVVSLCNSDPRVIELADCTGDRGVLSMGCSRSVQPHAAPHPAPAWIDRVKADWG